MRKNYIRTLQSILRQDYKTWRLYVINDRSTDNTLAIVKSYVDTRIKVFSLDRNKGLVNALNFGLHRISERFVFRIDADDEMLENRISLQIKMANSGLNSGIYMWCI